MSFTAGVYYGNEMRMNNYIVTLHMITNTNDATSHNVAFERTKYFVYNCLDSTIFVNQEHESRCNQFVSAGLSITTLPGEPVDQLIGLMLYYKLNAIMEDRIFLDETEIQSTLGENIVYLHSENEITDVPQIPDWWTTADPTHNDYMTMEANKILTMHAGSAWRDLDLNWTDSGPDSDTGNVVVFADFKPGNETK